MTSWTETPLVGLWNDLTPPAASIMTRQDGQGMFYAGKLNALNAEPETGKTWLALTACLEQLRARQHVLYVDFEDDVRSIVGRLKLMGAHRSAVESLFHYVRPTERYDESAVRALAALIDRCTPALAVIDGVAEAMATNGLDELDNKDIVTFFKSFPGQLAEAGAAVLVLDHVTKSAMGRGGYARGGGHKKGAIDGATYELTAKKPMGRGRTGVSAITVTKDRPGGVRGACTGGKRFGVMEVVSTGDSAVSVIVRALTEDDLRPTWTMQQVSEFLASQPGGQVPTSRVKEAVTGKAERIIEALTELVAGGWATVTNGQRNAKLYTSVKPYRRGDGSEAWDGELEAAA